MRRVYDPGGSELHMLLDDDSVASVFTADQLEESQQHLFRAALEDSLPTNIKGASVVVRAGKIYMGEVEAVVPKLTLDTGASSASYIGYPIFEFTLKNTYFCSKFGVITGKRCKL